MFIIIQKTVLYIEWISLLSAKAARISGLISLYRKFGIEFTLHQVETMSRGQIKRERLRLLSLKKQ